MNKMFNDRLDDTLKNKISEKSQVDWNFIILENEIRLLRKYDMLSALDK